MNIEERIKTEKRLVRHLIRVMKLSGWNILHIDDGEDIVKPKIEAEALDTVFSVDESHIFFTDGKRTHWVFIVLGNDGWDAICDYSAPDYEDGWNKTMEGVMEYANYLEDENR